MEAKYAPMKQAYDMNKVLKHSDIKAYNILLFD